MEMTIPSPTTILLRVLNIIGVLTVYVALFLHENEERQIQNRLEEWWVAIDTRRDRALSKSAAFVQGIARITGKGFDKIFGDDLMSIRTAGVSVCLSIASLLLVSLVTYIHSKPKMANYPLAFNIWWLFIYLCLGLTPVLIKNAWLIRLWAISVFVPLFKLCSFTIYVIYRGGHSDIALGLLVIIVAALGLSIVCDVLYIWFTRGMLRRVSTSSYLATMLILIFSSVLLAAFLIALPAYIGYELRRLLPVVGVLIGLVGVILNTVDLIVCSAVFVSAFLMIAHRLLWPLLERLVYPLQRYNIMREKKQLFYVGITLMTLPTHTAAGIFKFLIQKVL